MAPTTPDVGLQELDKLKSLTSLVLVETQITDVGLRELRKLTNLTMLQLRDSHVTDAGVKELQEVCPNLKIIR